ncbi:unnamed protein product [Leptosia nina]|uniref:Uncharacterized protein n=1 Tax=Leptosia nina TaxID=320188 RepID=A0AAV1JC62_9NEOP
MKDLVQIWSRVTGRQYSSVNTGERELRDFTNNRLKNLDLDSGTYEANFSECEGLNKYDDLDFNERKDAIINRLFEKRRKGQITRQPKNATSKVLIPGPYQGASVTNTKIITIVHQRGFELLAWRTSQARSARGVFINSFEKVEEEVYDTLAIG